MSSNELKPFWNRHKQAAYQSEISIDEIMMAIQPDLKATSNIEKLLRNGVLFSVLLIFCQAC